MNHPFTIKMSVSSQQISDIMSSALSGMTYWADGAYIIGDETDMYNSDAISNGRQLRIRDAESEKWHILTLKKFLKGLSLSPRFDYDNYDMYDAERVVQLALFGEEIYG